MVAFLYIAAAIGLMVFGAMVWDTILMSLRLRTARQQLRTARQNLSETLARTAEPVDRPPTV